MTRFIAPTFGRRCRQIINNFFREFPQKNLSFAPAFVRSIVYKRERDGAGFIFYVHAVYKYLFLSSSDTHTDTHTHTYT